MTSYFSKIRSAPTTYVDDNDGALIDSRFVVYRHGEDPGTVVRQFWVEHGGEGPFDIIPVCSFGNAPRRELCTQKSLVAALQTAEIDPGSVTEMHWRAVVEHHKVHWPKRLQNGGS